MALVSTSGIAGNSESARSCRERGGRKMSAFRAESPPTVERTKAKGQEVKHRRIADLVPWCNAVEHYSRRYLGSLAVSAAFERYSRLPLALRDENFKCRKSSLVSFSRFAVISRKTPSVLMLFGRRRQVSERAGLRSKSIPVRSRSCHAGPRRDQPLEKSAVDVPAPAG